MINNWIPSLIIGVALSIPGLALWAFADELDVYPFVGFRIAYATVSKDLWKRMNRISGKVLGLIGLFSIPIGLFFGLLWEILIYAISVAMATLVLIEYARSQAERESLRIPAREEKPPSPISMGTTSKLAISLFTISSSILLSIALRKLLYEGIGLEILIAFLPYFILMLYMTYLSIFRPEAYALPWIKEEGTKVLAITVPVSLSLIGIALSALMLCKSSLYWIFTLVLSFTILILAFITQLKMPKEVAQ